jgi:hypothetical protein
MTVVSCCLLALYYVQGPLPTDWATVSSPAMIGLRTFACAKCGLSGSLPPWGDSVACNGMMEHFDVSGNAFTGTVPNTMEGWLNLRHFDVSSNQLTEVFPGTPHCSLEGLKVLRVARNNLAGTVPLGEPPTVTYSQRMLPHVTGMLQVVQFAVHQHNQQFKLRPAGAVL